MTIAAGFNCYDGILIATDTLYSGGTDNDYGDKVWIIQGRDPVVVFAGTGTVGAITRARDEIDRLIKPGMSFQRTLDSIDDALLRVHKKFPPQVGWPPLVQALVAIRAEDRNRLYQNISGETALSPVDGPHVCLGAVEALGNYFARSLFREGILLEWAEIVTAYMVANCKEYAAGSCGGDTHLAAIYNDVKVPPIIKTSQEYMGDLVNHLSGMGRGLQAVLPGGSPAMSPTAETLKTRAAFIIKAIERAETDSYDLPHEGIDVEASAEEG